VIRQAATAQAAGTSHRVGKASPAQEPSTPAHPRLTTREVDVIELAMLGLTNGQIAERLNLSTYAVKFHLSSAYGKLGVANRTQAAVAYLHLKEEGQI
jgi:DNA-binding NarL/FixJ family response regulator